MYSHVDESPVLQQDLNNVDWVGSHQTNSLHQRRVTTPHLGTYVGIGSGRKFSVNDEKAFKPYTSGVSRVRDNHLYMYNTISSRLRYSRVKLQAIAKRTRYSVYS